MIAKEIPMDVIEAPDPSVPAVSVEEIIKPTPSMTQSLVITHQEVFALIGTFVLGHDLPT